MANIKKAYIYTLEHSLPVAVLSALCMIASFTCRVLYYSRLFEGSFTPREIIFLMIFPLLANALFVISILFRPGKLRLTIFPVLLGVTFFIIKALSFEPLHMALCIVLYSAVGILYLYTVCGRISVKLPLVLAFALPLVYHIVVEDIILALRTNKAEWMAEISVLFIIASLLLLSLGMRKKELNIPYRRRGDRNDGRRIRTIPPMDTVSPYIMVSRNGASNMFRDEILIAKTEKYINAKRKEGLRGFGIMHVLVAAYIRTISEMPAINRFISGQRVYTRDDLIEINLDIKKEMRAESPDTVVKFFFNPRNTSRDVYEIMKNTISENKNDTLDSGMDNVAALLSYIPGLLMKNVVWFLKLLDYFRLLPRALTKISPFHGSLFITSMGSLGIPPVFHHLYDFGNVPAFVSFGMKRKRNVLGDDGTVSTERFVDVAITIDERIVDGFYYAQAIKLFKKYMQDPFILDTPPAEVKRDID